MNPEYLRKIWAWLVPNGAPVVINYSGGNASAYAIRAIIAGLLPRPADLLVVFADTGSEKSSTYPHVDAMESLCAEHGIEFVRCSAWDRPPRDPKTWAAMALDTTRSKLHDVLLALPMFPVGSRMDNPPLYVDRDGTRGQVANRCTRHFKTRPMARVVKAWAETLRNGIGCDSGIGVGDERSRIGARPLVVRWIGYTSDEAHRVAATMKHKEAFEGWLRFPGVVMNKSRGQVDAETVAWGYELAPWSACVCCPHDSIERTQAMDAEDLAVRVACDEAIRDASAIGITDGPCYLSDQLVPVAEVAKRGRAQMSLPGLSPCGAGYCIS